ncbi:type IV toxin-antitoxin system AbiEi family antitoxin domain-containing protein [Pseudonocardia sp. DSM 110487]|uniref:type IV toxin-antitoxin system AbiEi family antitoxin domain-containing protein n=1 Tax=Pseudonocardia sp. DSM 110487 TaxID=2865833 RepID=UPI001C6A8210|nr:type IV toxin-antitoxin system AbiEi family antitoxin domain-containing protein [Pseudonocardia sp. DSM 110487]QYN32143.1 type IV toxin-antitoxin system AbiEi family antitoxin domain-containing protein [Pseudonocardia sp. DSM 110487]
MDIPRLVVRRQLLAAGWTDHELRRQLRSGELVRLGRGSYLPAPGAPPRFEVRHALLAAVRDERQSADGVLSHVSAAVLHGLSTWGLPLDRIHRTRDRRTGGRVGEGVHVYAAPLAPDEVAEVGGLLVTSPARTVIDIARTAGLEAAVAVADSALHKHLADPDELARAARRCTGWPGALQARRVVALADGDSDSVGESRSRLAIQRAGLPAPVLQWKVEGNGRVFEVDFGWPELHTVGEFDGLFKYGRLLKPGQDPADVVVAEKLREDEIRDLDLRVVRWIWPEIDDFDPVAGRLRRAFAASPAGAAWRR